MNYRVTLADNSQNTTTQTANPYDGLKVAIEGHPRTVAAFLDETVCVFDAVMGGYAYKQGEETDRIQGCIESGQTFCAGNMLWNASPCQN